jgi:hypothetical protein
VVWKERLYDGMLWWAKGHYLVYTIDSDGVPRVFVNDDSILRGKLNSSDIYTLITIGNSYRFDVVGRRSTGGSQYENIISMELIDDIEVPEH